ncbi:hypothetical protein C0J52_03913 [Blattella germanica]|nr:hypothetical protein C0J52_03913 [Blattella germanica]
MWCLALLWAFAVLCDAESPSNATRRRHLETLPKNESTPIEVLISKGKSNDTSTVSNGHGDATLEVLGGSPVGMVSADWDSDGMAVALANASGRFTSLEALLDVFNPQRLGRQWDYPRGDMTAMCGLHMHQYLSQLDKGKLWALKGEFSKHFSKGEDVIGAKTILWSLVSIF